MHPKSFSMTANLQYDTQSMDACIQLIETVIDYLAINKTIRFFLKVAVNELVVNAVEHGYNKQAGTVSIYLKTNHDSVVLEVSDYGKGVKPELLVFSKPINSLEDLTQRGWGLSILNKVSSSMQITSNTPIGTIVTITLPL